MKGGITSGVVYPHAIIEIARTYRLRSIGGTSAGAIGAVFAAAAEYRRQTGGGKQGFDAIGEVADELGTDMGALFQPSPEMRPLFDLMMAAVAGKGRAGGVPRALVGAILGGFRGEVLAGVAVFVVILVLAIAIGSFWLGVLGLVLGLLATVGLVLRALGRLVLVRLPANDFGLCPGRTIDGATKQGFSDWIADKIDTIAGNLDADGRPAEPLTIGQLASQGISVATMSTDLSSERPYQLPLRTDIHYFSKAEFEVLFPPRIVQYLCDKGGARSPDPSDGRRVPGDLYKLPHSDDFPVLLVARMSLSFPGLIRAVPLYRVDYDRPKDKPALMRRCLFSDGGISSNFPIHFFDALLPSRPTFGIALSSWEEARHAGERIDLPDRGRQSTSFPVNEITDVGAFLFAILNTAKDWQDSMQSLLPGYAERIVTVRLDDSREGGMNLNMSRATIDTLTGYGREAGQRLKTQFDMDQHRYDRAISLLPALEESLDGIGKAYDTRPAGAAEDALTYAEVLTGFDTRHYTKNSSDWRRDPFAQLAEGLAALGKRGAELHDDPARKSIRQGNVPSTDSQIRLVAIADRVPKGAGSAES